MDEDDTVNHYEANYQFIFTWSMIRFGARPSNRPRKNSKTDFLPKNLIK